MRTFKVNKKIQFERIRSREILHEKVRLFQSFRKSESDFIDFANCQSSVHPSPSTKHPEENKQIKALYSIVEIKGSEFKNNLVSLQF